MTVGIILNNQGITQFVESVTLSGDTSKFNRTLSVKMIASENGRKRAFTINEGDPIAFRYNDQLRFVGVVFSYDISSDGSLNITAYDSNVYFAKSNDSRIFINKKASDIIRTLATDFGVWIGDIADTGYVIPYLRLSNQTLYEMILKALTITRKQTNRRFFIGNKGGKLTLTEGVSNTKYLFKDGENLISASYSRSIEETKTQVKVIGGPKGKESVVVVKDADKRKKYGVLQALEEMDEKATASQVKQRADALLKEQSVVAEQLSVNVLGVPEVDVGTPVYIINEMTATNGGYYVTSVSHEYSAGLHTMSLELTRTYDLPEIEINSDEINRPQPKPTAKPKPKSKTKSKSKSKTKKKTDPKDKTPAKKGETKK